MRQVIRSQSRWPNTISFPKELRDAIPDYGPRALVFDSVSGAHSRSWVPTADGARAQLGFLVHETGKLNGQFTLLVDLDAETTRALEKFLVDLADQAEANKG
jgi:hypothetical protein